MNERLNRASAREIITVPPHGEPQLVCPLWPDCDCRSDCTAGGERRRALWIARALGVTAVLIGAGLLFAGLR
ncbi:hypothetical protein P9279_21895 [Mesorhizobium sp. WSM4962]|uniref:hypothetical protein n=1 Tax=Mesorhizobium sp. WSM4962 TaxID=3038548 RepID=UPI002417AA03|nr:hypothetical protein [Mesorhizobium sp. WSM4962]MDG4903165.1 hypothetical protein [Mesorhizobium sp. WSM4962]